MAPILKQPHFKVLSQEPTGSSDLIPLHLKRNAAAENPIVEIAYRFASHFQLNNAVSFERLVALIALVKVISPLWHRLKQFLLESLASHISIAESDPIAQEIMQWIYAEVISNSLSTSATVTSSAAINYAGIKSQTYTRGYSKLKIHSGRVSYEPANNNEIVVGARPEAYNEAKIQCLPPVGKKIFW